MGIKLKGLNLGYMGIDYEVLVFPHPDHVLHTDKKEGQKTWYQCPAISYIIEHPDGLVLWETGISTQWPEEWLSEWQWLIDVNGITPEVCLENRLKEIGLGPDDFKYVIQGHLHTDHSGGLRLFQDAGAEIVVQEDEWKAVENLQAAENFFVPADFVLLKDKKPTLVSGDTELMRDLRLVSVPGHTPGTQGCLVRLDHTGWVLLTSDALYTHDSYGPPPTGTPITWDVATWAQSVEKIRTLAQDHEAFIFPGHDETGIKQHKEESEFQKIDFWPGYAYE
jgi:N-acyl homoserine lactone hydrolase